MNEVYSLSQTRKANWGKNACRYLLRRSTVKNRDSNLWVFSSWNGMRYADNARYLFEYVMKNYPEIRCLWQTKNNELYDKLLRDGIDAQLIGTKEAETTQKKAGVAVYTNGVDDFGDVPFVYGAKLVCLWHGISLKKTYRLQLPEKRNPIIRFLSNAKWDLFNYMKQDITVSTSEYISEWFYQGFRLKNKDGICICGQARNDAFAGSPMIPDDIADSCRNKKVILYMPTFRNDNSILIREIEAIFASETIQKLLKVNNCILLCKLHFLCHASVQNTDCCFLLNDESVTDVQKLQLAADMLISDYSGSGIDYALLKRPIMFYFPDWREYRADELMMPETKMICGINTAWNRDEFVSVLEEMLSNPERGLRQAARINEFFNTADIPVGEFSQKNFEGICQLLRRMKR